MDLLRTFISVEIPDSIKNLMLSKQEELRTAMGPAAGAVRWSRPEGTHLTLQFLGDVPAASIAEIADRMCAGCEGGRPLELALGRTGAFPGIVKPRVLWMGLEGDTGHLQTLQSRIAEQLATLGYKPDKPFKPHITLGRVRDTVRRNEMDAISHALRLQENSPINLHPFTAYRVSLMRSELHPGGSIYTELAGIELA